jgi:hypothetical protein
MTGCQPVGTSSILVVRSTKKGITMKKVWLYMVLLVVCAGLVVSCEDQPTANEADKFACNWEKPDTFMWYGTPEGIEWKNPQAIKYEDKNFIRIIAQDGTPFLIYGQCVIKGIKK